jgi:putative ABC transport system ATP-binding protein
MKQILSSKKPGMNGHGKGPQPVVTLDNISRVFGTGEAAVRACDRVSLNIYPGEYCAVMGQSGSGKSTLMNLIGCLDRPTAGRYLLDGMDVSALGRGQLSRIRNRKIGFVFQRYELLANLTALDNVILPMMYAGMGRAQRRRRAETALMRMGLGNRMDKRPSQLSGGQQQRVAIARAIVNQPVLILADEPTGALDSHSAAEVLAIFEELHRNGITIVTVTHSYDVASHSRRIIMMSDGQVTHAHLTPGDLQALTPL